MTRTLVGKGRTADVFALEGGRVLRQYREPREIEPEAAAMEHARSCGVPVPGVFQTRDSALVMEQVEGPTMLADAASHPWRLLSHARTLARLHNLLHAVPALPGLPEPFGPGSSLLHRDLHPDNVLLSPHGPVIIDWTSASNGPGPADVASTWLLLDTSEVPRGPLQRAVAGAGRALFLRQFLQHAGRAEARPFLAAVGLQRLEYQGLIGREAAAVNALLAKEGVA